MVGKFLGSLFGNGPTSHAVAEQRFVDVDEREDELANCAAALSALRQILRANGAELPTLAYSQFRQIDDLLATLTVYLQESGASVEQTVLLGAMVSDYLPTSLSTYLKLAKSVRREDSPESAALFAQLATLHATAVDLDKQVRSGAATELAVHGRFLQDKFDLSSLHLEGS
ncbi:hypothetical protein [Arthrobacter sp. NPDC057013]|uniref:hypothetical protein n=1 Tax=Arthrobacter sp. NPDC057013 TaxID=3345999 RepID=UPI0036268388